MDRPSPAVTRRRSPLVTTALSALAAVAVTGAVAGQSIPAAAATPVPPPPPSHYVATKQCVSSGSSPTTVKDGVGWAQQTLRFTSAWKFSDGTGVTVAVIDTGINPGPEFGGRLTGIGDLVAPGTGGPPGLDDCDGHGTLVAGIIGAAPDEVSGFTGVAPGAHLVSIRQSSEYFGAQSGAGLASDKGAGTTGSLASAISYAVARKVGVINISLAECGPAGSIDSPALTKAVTDAVDAGVVIVAAAGNLSSGGTCSQQNTPGSAPLTAATPADVPGVLAVAAVGQDGAPAPFSIAGPWVGVAAPGTDIIATNPFRGSTGQVNQIATSTGAGSIQGTSFAAPYVTGVVALVRARFPLLSPAQVVHRIEATAAHPAAPGGRNDYVGFGMIDPIAALSTTLPDQAGVASAPARARALEPERTESVSWHPQHVALEGSLVVALLLLVLAVATQARRIRRTRHG